MGITESKQFEVYKLPAPLLRSYVCQLDFRTEIAEWCAG
jgi:hypothetical protein